MSNQQPATSSIGEADRKVDVTSIERQLAELWRAEKHDGERAVTRAALWNVVAHAWTAAEHAHATEVLARASASVPQRTIVIRPIRTAADSIASWISANCHSSAADVRSVRRKW
jgi:hypothetical protein